MRKPKNSDAGIASANKTSRRTIVIQTEHKHLPNLALRACDALDSRVLGLLLGLAHGDQADKRVAHVVLEGPVWHTAVDSSCIDVVAIAVAHAAAAAGCAW